MAGGWHHVTSEEGELSEPRRIHDMLDSEGDVFEAIAQMHGMIAWLAYRLAVVSKGEEPTRRDVLAIIEQAREHYGDVVTRWDRAEVSHGLRRHSPEAGLWRNL